MFRTADPAPPTWLEFPVTPAKLFKELIRPGAFIMPADHAKLLQKAEQTLGQFTDKAPEKKIEWKTSKTTRTERECA